MAIHCPVHFSMRLKRISSVKLWKMRVRRSLCSLMKMRNERCSLQELETLNSREVGWNRPKRTFHIHQWFSTKFWDADAPRTAKGMVRDPGEKLRYAIIMSLYYLKAGVGFWQSYQEGPRERNEW